MGEPVGGEGGAPVQAQRIRRTQVVTALVAVLVVVLGAVGAVLITRNSGHEIDYAALARYQTAAGATTMTEDQVRAEVEQNGWECDNPNSGASKRALALEQGGAAAEAVLSGRVLEFDYFICGDDDVRAVIERWALSDDQKTSALRRLDALSVYRS